MTEREEDVLVYVGTYTEDPADGIHCLRMNLKTGALTPLSTTPGVSNPFFLVISADRTRLYASISVDELDGEPGGAVSAFAVNGETGELSFLNRQPACGTFPCYLSIDPTGRHLLLGNYNSGSVAVLPIADDGHLGPPTDSAQHEGSSVNPERQDGPHVHSIVLDPSGTYAYVADLGIDKVLVYRLDAAGTLAPVEPATVETAAGAGPRHLRFHPTRPYTYLLNELNGTLTAFSFDEGSGSLSEIETMSTLPSAFDGPNYAADLQFLPDGSFLYSSNRGHDSIAIFAVDPESGRPTPAGHATAAGSWPWNLAIAPGAGFLLAANYESDSVAVLKIDRATGQLSATGHEVPVPKAVNLAFL